MCDLSQFKSLRLDTYHKQVLEDELKRWHTLYLPKTGKLPDTVLNGEASVLDIGAGNGETAQFYLNHGAQSVICIDASTQLLRQNFKGDKRIKSFEAYIGFIKSDCEGGERDMVVEGGHGLPMQWHCLENENRTIYNRTWRLEEDWEPLWRKALRKVGVKMVG